MFTKICLGLITLSLVVGVTTRTIGTVHARGLSEFKAVDANIYLPTPAGQTYRAADAKFFTLQEALDLYAKDGWDLVCVLSIPTEVVQNNRGAVRAIFRKEK